jgi:hypothetical protein
VRCSDPRRGPDDDAEDGEGDGRLQIRLGRYFGTDALFWINLQVAHDL